MKRISIIGPSDSNYEVIQPLYQNVLDRRLQTMRASIESRDSVQSNSQVIGGFKIKFLGKYIIGDEIGVGSFGKVKDCINVETLKLCAVKIMRRSRLRKMPRGEANLLKEIRLLWQFDHENVIAFIEVLENVEKEKWYIFLELCVTSVQDLINHSATKYLSEYQAHMYYSQLIKGLEYIHSRGVFHMDIKPGNLLLTASHKLKISDFGVAEVIDLYLPSDNCESCMGSPMFHPPECAMGEDTFSGSKVDVWASGVTLYYMTTGEYPFVSEYLFRLYETISVGKFVIPPKISEPLTNLFYHILEKDPRVRYSIEKIKQDDWVNSKDIQFDESEFIPLSFIKDRLDINIFKKLDALYYPQQVSKPASEEIIRIINYEELRNN